MTTLAMFDEYLVFSIHICRAKAAQPFDAFLGRFLLSVDMLFLNTFPSKSMLDSVQDIFPYSFL